MSFIRLERKIGKIIILCFAWIFFQPAFSNAQANTQTQDSLELKWEIGLNGFYFFNKVRYHPVFVKRLYEDRKAIRFSANLQLNYFQGGLYDDERFKLGPLHYVGFRIGHEWRNKSKRLCFYRGIDLSYDWLKQEFGVSFDIVRSGESLEIKTWDYLAENNHSLGLVGFAGLNVNLTPHLSISLESQLSAAVHFTQYSTGISNIQTGEDNLVADEQDISLISELRPIYFLGLSYQF